MIRSIAKRLVTYSFGALSLVSQITMSDEDVSQSLEQAASDPTASLMSVQIQNLYTNDFHNLEDATGNIVLFRSAIPFSTGGINQIARITLPYVTDTPSGESGLGDLVLFDLVVFNKSWGRWGVGPVLLAPTGKNSISIEKWGIGPAIGFVAQSPGLIGGVFNQNIFSFSGEDQKPDVDISIIQPILNYSLPNKWSLGTSEMNITYDWNAEDWTSLPLGIKLAKLKTFGTLPVQFSLAYEHNFYDDETGPENTINFTAKFLFPTL